jgi:DNA-binding CsgD family transcriptional regulator
MARAEAIFAIVRRIHEASLTADAWGPVLQSISNLLEGDHAILLASDPARADGGPAVAIGIDNSALARFASPEAESWIGSAMRTIGSGAAVTRSRLMPDRQFERTDFYNEVVRPAGGFHSLGVAHQMPALSSFVTVCRRKQAGDFDADDTALMQTLAPHFATALLVRQHLGAADLATKAAWTALERLNTGVIVVDARASIVFANKIAELLFAARDLRLDRDGICTRDSSVDRRMRRLIAACTARAAAPHAEVGGTFELGRSPARAGLRISVTPFQFEPIGLGPDGTPGPLALLLISDPQRDRNDRITGLQQRFGLTFAEASFALEIIKGDGRAAAAARSGITVGTARTHLEHIFEKAGVRRQAELVHLLLSDK